jgi:hypothetical protein
MQVRRAHQDGLRILGILDDRVQLGREALQPDLRYLVDDENFAFLGARLNHDCFSGGL